MKKTIKLLGLFAMAALLFSCEKKLDNNLTPGGDPAGPSTENNELDPSVYLLSFGARFENDEADTKVSITFDGNTATPAFEENDEVLVHCPATGATALYQYDGTLFKPTADAIAAGSNVIHVYYPASEFVADASGVTFTMPDAIAAGSAEDLGDKVPMAGILPAGNADDPVVTFKNLCSILRVRLTGSKSDTRKVSWVSVENSSIPLAPAGSYSIAWSGDEPSLSENAATNCIATIEASSGISLDADDPTDFFFLLPPTATSMSDMVVTVKMDATESTYSTDKFSRSRNGSMAITRNKIINLSFRAGYFYDGTGTETAPYQIKTADDFKRIATNDAFLDKHFVQIDDIDFNSSKLTPIGGDSSNSFVGEYDGNDKEIKNVNIDVDTQFAALFGYVKGNASIHDLTISSGSIKSTTTASNSLTGSIAGILNGSAQVANCVNKANITASSATYTGGIVGRLYGANSSITGCTNNGSVTSSSNYTGGIAGQLANNSGSGGTISSCHNTAAIKGVSQIGGIVGAMDNGKVSACENSGNITATATEAGGIAGQIRGGVITTCFSAKNVTITGTSRLGGIAGYQENRGSSAGSLIINCAASSKLYSTGDGNNGAAGGLVGNMYSVADKGDVILANSVALKNCIYNFRSTSETWDDSKLGGVIGRVNGALCYVRNCYSQHDGSETGAIYCSKNKSGSTIDKKKQTNMGGIYGALEVGTVQNCYCMGNVATGAGISAANTLVGAGSKASGTATGNTRVFNEEIMNGAATITFTSNNIAVNGITLASISPATLLVLMDAGTWSSSAKTDRTNYTISGFTESFSEWEAIIGGSFPYPKVLNNLGSYYRP